jgi:hypothetical protein
LARIKKRAAYFNVFMYITLLFLPYSLFTTSAGFSLAAFQMR